MGIERFEAGGDAGRVRECYEIFRATKAADNPDIPVTPPGVFAGWLQTGWVGDPRETWLLAGQGARDGVDGWYLLELPSRDNKHLAGLELMVRPGRQRRGLGTALLRHAAGRALADGRRLLTGYACPGRPARPSPGRPARPAGWPRSTGCSIWARWTPRTWPDCARGPSGRRAATR